MTHRLFSIVYFLALVAIFNIIVVLGSVSLDASTVIISHQVVFVTLTLNHIPFSTFQLFLVNDNNVTTITPITNCHSFDGEILLISDDDVYTLNPENSQMKCSMNVVFSDDIVGTHLRMETSTADSNEQVTFPLSKPFVILKDSYIIDSAPSLKGAYIKSQVFIMTPCYLRISLGFHIEEIDPKLTDLFSLQQYNLPGDMDLSVLSHEVYGELNGEFVEIGSVYVRSQSVIVQLRNVTTPIYIYALVSNHFHEDVVTLGIPKNNVILFSDNIRPQSSIGHSTFALKSSAPFFQQNSASLITFTLNTELDHPNTDELKLSLLITSNSAEIIGESLCHDDKDDLLAVISLDITKYDGLERKTLVFAFVNQSDNNKLNREISNNTDTSTSSPFSNADNSLPTSTMFQCKAYLNIAHQSVNTVSRPTHFSFERLLSNFGTVKFSPFIQPVADSDPTTMKLISHAKNFDKILVVTVAVNVPQFVLTGIYFATDLVVQQCVTYTYGGPAHISIYRDSSTRILMVDITENNENAISNYELTLVVNMVCHGMTNFDTTSVIDNYGNILAFTYLKDDVKSTSPPTSSHSHFTTTDEKSRNDHSHFTSNLTSEFHPMNVKPRNVKSMNVKSDSSESPHIDVPDIDQLLDSSVKSTLARFNNLAHDSTLVLIDTKPSLANPFIANPFTKPTDVLSIDSTQLSPNDFTDNYLYPLSSHSPSHSPSTLSSPSQVTTLSDSSDVKMFISDISSPSPLLSSGIVWSSTYLYLDFHRFQLGHDYIRDSLFISSLRPLHGNVFTCIPQHIYTGDERDNIYDHSQSTFLDCSTNFPLDENPIYIHLYDSGIKVTCDDSQVMVSLKGRLPISFIEQDHQYQNNFPILALLTLSPENIPMSTSSYLFMPEIIPDNWFRAEFDSSLMVGRKTVMSVTMQHPVPAKGLELNIYFINADVTYRGSRDSDDRVMCDNVVSSDLNASPNHIRCKYVATANKISIPVLVTKTMNPFTVRMSAQLPTSSRISAYSHNYFNATLPAFDLSPHILVTHKTSTLTLQVPLDIKLGQRSRMVLHVNPHAAKPLPALYHNIEIDNKCVTKSGQKIASIFLKEFESKPYESIVELSWLTNVDTFTQCSFDFTIHSPNLSVLNLEYLHRHTASPSNENANYMFTNRMSFVNFEHFDIKQLPYASDFPRNQFAFLLNVLSLTRKWVLTITNFRTRAPTDIINVTCGAGVVDIEITIDDDENQINNINSERTRSISKNPGNRLITIKHAEDDPFPLDSICTITFLTSELVIFDDALLISISIDYSTESAPLFETHDYKLPLTLKPFPMKASITPLFYTKHYAPVRSFLYLTIPTIPLTQVLTIQTTINMDVIVEDTDSHWLYNTFCSTDPYPNSLQSEEIDENGLTHTHIPPPHVFTASGAPPSQSDTDYLRGIYIPLIDIYYKPDPENGAFTQITIETSISTLVSPIYCRLPISPVDALPKPHTTVKIMKFTVNDLPEYTLPSIPEFPAPKPVEPSINIDFYEQVSLAGKDDGFRLTFSQMQFYAVNPPHLEIHTNTSLFDNTHIADERLTLLIQDDLITINFNTNIDASSWAIIFLIEIGRVKETGPTHLNVTRDGTHTADLYLPAVLKPNYVPSVKIEGNTGIVSSQIFSPYTTVMVSITDYPFDGQFHIASAESNCGEITFIDYVTSRLYSVKMNARDVNTGNSATCEMRVDFKLRIGRPEKYVPIQVVQTNQFNSKMTFPSLKFHKDVKAITSAQVAISTLGEIGTFIDIRGPIFSSRDTISFDSRIFTHRQPELGYITLTHGVILTVAYIPEQNVYKVQDTEFDWDIRDQLRVLFHEFPIYPTSTTFLVYVNKESYLTDLNHQDAHIFSSHFADSKVILNQDVHLQFHLTSSISNDLIFVLDYSTSFLSSTIDCVDLNYFDTHRQDYAPLYFNDTNKELWVYVNNGRKLSYSFSCTFTNSANMNNIGGFHVTGTAMVSSAKNNDAVFNSTAPAKPTKAIEASQGDSELLNNAKTQIPSTTYNLSHDDEAPVLIIFNDTVVASQHTVSDESFFSDLVDSSHSHANLSKADLNDKKIIFSQIYPITPLTFPAAVHIYHSILFSLTHSLTAADKATMLRLYIKGLKQHLPSYDISNISIIKVEEPSTLSSNPLTNTIPTLVVFQVKYDSHNPISEFHAIVYIKNVLSLLNPLFTIKEVLPLQSSFSHGICYVRCGVGCHLCEEDERCEIDQDCLSGECAESGVCFVRREPEEPKNFVLNVWMICIICVLVALLVLGISLWRSNVKCCRRPKHSLLSDFDQYVTSSGGAGDEGVGVRVIEDIDLDW